MARMRTLPSIRTLGPAIVVALALGVASGAAGPAGAQEQPVQPTQPVQRGGGMAVDCEGNTRALDRECSFGAGQEFTVSLHVTDASDQGFYGFQAKLRWAPDVVAYHGPLKPDGTPDTDQEAVWQDCDVAARSDNSALEPVEPTVLIACVPIPAPASGFDDTGPVWLFPFACTGEGNSTLSLVAREGDPQDGSSFLDAATNVVDPDLQSAEVTCGGADVTRPAQEVTTRQATPIFDQTPAATTPGGPTETPGGPTSTPGGPTPTAEATPDGDDDDDDGGFPMWAWIVIGVGAVAGTGGAGYLAWRRMRARGSAAT